MCTETRAQKHGGRKLGNAQSCGRILMSGQSCKYLYEEIL